MQAGSASLVRSIEFFGLPGCGKTTIARELLALLRENGLSASFSREIMGDGTAFGRRTLRRLALVAGQAPRSPGGFWRGVRLIQSQSEGLGDSLHSIWNFLSVQAMAVQQLRGRGLMVLDQGLVQAIWSARMSEVASGGAAAWEELIGGDWLDQCLFVQVECGSQVAMERLRAREERTSRMQRAERLDELALWSKGETLVSELGKMVEAGLRRTAPTGRLILIRTDDGSGAPALAALVLSQLFDSLPAAPRTGEARQQQGAGIAAQA